MIEVTTRMQENNLIIQIKENFPHKQNRVCEFNFNVVEEQNIESFLARLSKQSYLQLKNFEKSNE